MQEVYLFESNDTVTYEILRAEHIPKNIEKYMAKRNIVTNSFRIQAYDLICGYFWTVSTNAGLNNKRTNDFTSLFSTNNFKEHDKNISIFSNILIIYNETYITLIIYILYPYIDQILMDHTIQELAIHSIFT